MARVARVLAGAVLLLGACSSAHAGPEARTYYESLDLSSPEAAVETFVGAFLSDDFMTVWLTFDYHAQREIRESFNLVQYNRLVDTEQIPDPGKTITNPIADLIGRGNIDMWHIFDHLMLVADEHDALLIDFGELDSIELVGDAASGEATLLVKHAGSDDEFVINLSQGDGDRWFVHQVIALGGDTEQIPWSAP